MKMNILALLFLAIAASHAHAVEVGSCYKLKLNESGDDSFYLSYFCSQKRTNEQGQPVLGIGIFVTTQENSETTPLSCGAAEYVTVTQQGDLTKVNTGFDEGDLLTFNNKSGRFNLGELVPETEGTFSRTTPAEQTKLLSTLNAGFESRHCEVAKSQPNDLTIAVEAKDLQFDFTGSDLRPEDLQASFEMNCWYKVGFWPFEGSRNCGSNKSALRFNADGALVIPQVVAANLEGAGNVENYKTSIKITKGDENIVWFSTNGGDDLTKFNEFDKTFLVTKLKGGKLGIDYQGKDFFQTMLPMLDDASIAVSLEVSFNHSFDQGFQIFDIINWHTLGGNNRSYTPKDRQLKLMKEFVAPDTYLVSVQAPEELTLRYYANYESETGSTAEIQVWNQHYEKLSENGASQLPRLQLIERKN